LFANSPFIEGKPNNFISYRAHIWTDTDPHRTGDMPFVFEDGFGFERYADYMLDVPMYFVYRDGCYIDAAGQSFRDFLDGRLPALPGEKPTMADWEDHITTAFPEVRLKRFIEMRGADGGRWDKICALPALWVGLLYDQGVLDAAWDLVKNWSAEDRAQLRTDVARQGFKASVAGRTVLEIAREVLALSREGLTHRRKRDNWGDDETQYLRRLQQIVDHGQTTSEEKLLKFEQDWAGDADCVFKAYAY
jgi:glutamate--cysteine ligase